MPNVSGTNDRWLQKGVALPVIYEKMEPYLIWVEHLIQIREEDNAFLYLYDSSGKSGDSKKKTPPMHTFPGRFPEIDRSVKSVSSAAMEAHGFAMRIPREVIRHSARGQAEIMDCYERAGYWLAEFINTDILSVLTSGASTPTWTPTNTWDNAAATPVDDLIRFAAEMDQEGYPFRFTDGFVDKTNFYELIQYLTSYDTDFAQKQAIFGIPNIKKDTVVIPIVEATIHKVMSGMSHGYLLGMDVNNRAAELHYYNDPQFSMAKVSYETVVDSKPQTKTVNNIGIHFQQIYEEDTHDTVLQFWYENRAVVTKTLGLKYDSGI